MWVEWEGPIAADERCPSVLRAAEAAAAISAICSVERYGTVYIYDLEPGFQTLTLGGLPQPRALDRSPARRPADRAECPVHGPQSGAWLPPVHRVTHRTGSLKGVLIGPIRRRLQ